MIKLFENARFLSCEAALLWRDILDIDALDDPVQPCVLAPHQVAPALLALRRKLFHLLVFVFVLTLLLLWLCLNHLFSDTLFSIYGC